MDRFRERRAAARATLIATLVALVCLGCAGSALGASSRGYARVEHVCRPPATGEAGCFALARVRVPASEAARPGVRALAAKPAAIEFGPAEGLTPKLLESAYGFDGKALGSDGKVLGSGKTVAVVDAFDDPAIEANLEEFSKNYGLPECTTANGCFEKVGQSGEPSKLPIADPNKGWSVEISLDVETVHSVCPECHILLVEAKNNEMTNLGLAVAKAVEMGAAVVSNSFGGPEAIARGATERALYEHPGTVIAAATGDFGYDRWAGPLPDPEMPDAPASYPGVVSVGGTTLGLNSEGTRSSETVWNSNGPLNEGEFEGGVSGGGCSVSFEAPFWQHYVPGFAATGCGDKRLSADVSAVADPNTGFDIFDTYDCGTACEEFIGSGGWSTIGGTSLSTPLISAMYALAGGADGISYPAITLYAHLGDGASLFDVTTGGNGLCDFEGRACGVNASLEEQLDCEGTTACNATAGYDGPSGVGAPASLSAFQPVPGEEAAARTRAEEAIAAEALRRAEEEAARQPKASSGQGGTAGFTAEKAAVAPAAVLRGTRLQAARGGFVTVKIACPAGETRCEGTVTLHTLGAAITGAGASASVVTLATGRFKVVGGHVVSVRLHLTRRGAALLRRKGKLRVRVAIAAHDPAGAKHSSHAMATLFAFKRH